MRREKDMNQFFRKDDYIYSRPMLAVLIFRRLIRRVTQRHRKVNLVIDVGHMPPPENQHFSGHKWMYFITLSFNRGVPTLRWDEMTAFNKLLSMTEQDRLIIGLTFVTVFTDRPGDYQGEELAQAVCKAFGLELNQFAYASEDELSRY
jgi:hypothetical protein